MRCYFLHSRAVFSAMPYLMRIKNGLREKTRFPAQPVIAPFYMKRILY